MSWLRPSKESYFAVVTQETSDALNPGRFRQGAQLKLEIRLNGWMLCLRPGRGWDRDSRLVFAVSWNPGPHAAGVSWRGSNPVGRRTGLPVRFRQIRVECGGPVGTLTGVRKRVCRSGLGSTGLEARGFRNFVAIQSSTGKALMLEPGWIPTHREGTLHDWQLPIGPSELNAIRQGRVSVNVMPALS